MSVADTQALVRDLADRDGVKRAAARSQLIEIGPSSLPYILPLLEDKEKRTRWEAAKVLSEMPGLHSGPIPPAELSAQALPLLEDKDSGVRWLAAGVLINVGPDAVAPVLRRLIERPDSQYLRQGAHRVFRELSLAYEPLRAVLAPLSDALESLSAADTTPEAAQKALRQVEALGSLERRDDVLSPGSRPEQYLFDSQGEWIAFRQGGFVFDTNGDPMGWLPWNDNEVVDLSGVYLGTLYPDDRFFQTEPAHVGSVPAFPGYPPAPPMVPIPEPRAQTTLPGTARDIKGKRL